MPTSTSPHPVPSSDWEPRVSTDYRIGAAILAGFLLCPDGSGCASVIPVVQLLVRITAATGQAGQLIEALRSVMRGVLRGGVCVDAHLASDVDDGDVVWYLEDWQSVEEFEQHLRSDRFTRLLAVLEISAEPPSLECRLVSDVRGLDYLAAVRGVARPEIAGHGQG